MSTLISLAHRKDRIVAYERISAEERVEIEYPLPLYYYKAETDGDAKSIFATERYKKYQAENLMQYRQLIEKHKGRTKTAELDIALTSKIYLDHYMDKPVDTKLNVCLFDIEVDYTSSIGFSSPSDPYAPINAVSLYLSHENRIYTIGIPPDKKDYSNIYKLMDPADGQIELVKTEKELLKRMVEIIDNCDIMSAWNGEFFDMPYVCKRLEKYGMSNKLNFDGLGKPSYKESIRFGSKLETSIRMSGRVQLDYMILFKKYNKKERQSFSLDAVCQDELKMKKIEHTMSLEKLYKNDFITFIEYNIRDAVLLRELEKKFGYIDLSIAYANECAVGIPETLKTLGITEGWINSYIRRNNEIVPDMPKAEVPKFTNEDGEEESEKAEGAVVLQPTPEMMKWVAITDVNSLYPSTIRSLNCSPETVLGHFINFVDDYDKIMSKSSEDVTLQFNGRPGTKTAKAKDWHKLISEQKMALSPYGVIFDQSYQGVIPKVLTDGYAKRKQYQKLSAEYKEKGDKVNADKYERLQRIQKLKLNSLYGALLNAFFRYYDFRLGSSVTAGGRKVAIRMAEYVHKVLTGTDGKVEHMLDPKRSKPTEPVYMYKMDSSVLKYIDTDSVDKDTKVIINDIEMTIEKAFEICNVKWNQGDKEFASDDVLISPTYNCDNAIDYIYRHKVSKPRYKVTTATGKSVIVTEDHSCIILDNGNLKDVKPTEIKTGDQVIMLGD